MQRQYAGKSKVIDSSLEQLKQRFAHTNPQLVAAQKVRDRKESLAEEIEQTKQAFEKESDMVQANADKLCSIMTVVYVGNLAQEVTENTLTKVFNRIGNLVYVKLMQPRNAEERMRKRNCAFVRFERFEPAFLAMTTLQDRHLMGMAMKLTWGKSIPGQVRALGVLRDYRGVQDSELEMQYIEKQLCSWLSKQNLPSTKDLQLTKFLEFKAENYENPVGEIKVNVPKNLKDRVILDKLAKQVAKEGFYVEEEIRRMVLDAAQGKPAKAAIKNCEVLHRLFVNGDRELSNYYQWRAYSFYNKDSKNTWRAQPFQMYLGGSIWTPPEPDEKDWQRTNPQLALQKKIQREQAIMKGLPFVETDSNTERQKPLERKSSLVDDAVRLPEEEKVYLKEYLTGIECSRISICEGMVFAMEYVEFAQDISESLCAEIYANKSSERLQALLFLISDILFNSSKVTNAWAYKREFERFLPNLMLHLATLDAQSKRVVKKILALWRDTQVCEEVFVQGWLATVKFNRQKFACLHPQEPKITRFFRLSEHLLEKVRLVVLPALQQRFQTLSEVQKETVQRECRQRGLPVFQSHYENVERLVCLEEFLIKQLLKAEDQPNSHNWATRRLKEVIQDDDLSSDLTFAERQDLVIRFQTKFEAQTNREQALLDQMNQVLSSIDDQNLEGFEMTPELAEMFEVDWQEVEKTAALLKRGEMVEESVSESESDSN